MPAPVTSVPSSGSTATSSGAVSLVPTNGGGAASALFARFLSMGITNGLAAPSLTATQAAQDNAAAAGNPANADPQTYPLPNSTLFLLSDNLSNMSEDDLKSLLASISNPDDALNAKILLSLTPGVPAKDALENLKSQLANLGVDITNFKPVIVSTAKAYSPPTPIISEIDGQITTPASDATDSNNLLLIATGLSPSEMDHLKERLKAAADAQAQISQDIMDADNAATSATALAVLVVFVAPLKQPETPTPAMSDFDLSSLSAFTQIDDGQSTEPDWSEQLSQKLSGMSLSDEASPFDDEMNKLLSFDSSKGKDSGFQGSIASLTPEKADTQKNQTSMTGDLSAQTGLSSSLGTSSSAIFQAFGESSLFMTNGGVSSHHGSSPLLNPVLSSPTAIGTHPTVQAVARLIEKSASGSEKARQELSIQLDPPELGRIQIQLSLEKDGAMKIHLLTDNQDTLNLLQRDSHVLKSALDSAGIQTDNSSLSFDLSSGDQSFNQLMGGSQDQQSNKGSDTKFLISADGAIQNLSDLHTIDTKMDFTPDQATGNIHYSLWA